MKIILVDCPWCNYEHHIDFQNEVYGKFDLYIGICIITNSIVLLKRQKVNKG